MKHQNSVNLAKYFSGGMAILSLMTLVLIFSKTSINTAAESIPLVPFDDSVSDFPSYMKATLEVESQKQEDRVEKKEEIFPEEFDLIENSNQIAIFEIPDITTDCETSLTNVVTNLDSGEGSLREALNFANSNSDCTTINFAIPESESKTINLENALPTIIEPVLINGRSQPEYIIDNPVPIIRIDGSLVANPVSEECGISGLCFEGTFDIIRSSVLSLSITGFANSGISYLSRDQVNSPGLILAGNYIGLTPEGLAAGNGGAGIALGNSSNHVIGGEENHNQNVIGNNGGDGIYLFGIRESSISGNLIGLSPNGQGIAGNGESGIYIDSSTNLLIGSEIDNGGNVISNNGQGIEDGITIIAESSNIQVLNNLIGTNASGDTIMPNTYAGVYIAFRNNIDIRIGSCLAGNVISGNGGADSSQQYGIFSFANRTIIEGNKVGVDSSGLSLLTGQNKDLVLVGDSGIVGGAGSCENQFKPGVENVQNLGFGNSFLENTGTNIPPNSDFNFSFVSGRNIDPADVILESNSTDVDGSIAKVSFIYQGISIATSETLPFVATWENVQSGIYPVYSQVVDNQGLTSKSLIKNIEIRQQSYNQTPWVADGMAIGENQLITFGNRVIHSIRGTDQGIYTRYSDDGEVWSPWSWSGKTSSPISMRVFNNKLFQAIQGTDTGIYTRYTEDGINWTGWELSGGTFDRVTMAVAGERLFQSIRGTDNGVYTRFTTDGINWSPWTPNGGTSDWVALSSIGNRLFQAIRGTDDGVYTRSTEDGINWTPWEWSGGTLTTPRLIALQDRIYLAIRGTDSNLYTAIINSDFNQSAWMPLDGIINTPRLGAVGRDVYLAYQQPTGNLCTRLLSGSDSIWSACEPGGLSLGASTFGLFEDRLFQARVSDGGVLSYRNVGESKSWTEWSNEDGVLASGGIAYTQLGESFIQSFFGSNNEIYTRKVTRQ